MSIIKFHRPADGNMQIGKEKFNSREIEWIEHNVHGIRLFVKYNHYESIEKIVFNIRDGGCEIFIVAEGFHHWLDLDRPEYDRTEEDREERKEWVCKNESLYNVFYEKYKKTKSRQIWEDVLEEIGRELGCETECLWDWY